MAAEVEAPVAEAVVHLDATPAEVADVDRDTLRSHE
jgi:hypothetical protein